MTMADGKWQHPRKQPPRDNISGSGGNIGTYNDGDDRQQGLQRGPGTALLSTTATGTAITIMIMNDNDGNCYDDKNQQWQRGDRQ
jgi:hypothetical protein